MAALRFTRSKDGVARATVRIDYRADAGTIAYALAHEAYGIPEPELFIRRSSRTSVSELVRDHFLIGGPPENWPEMGDDYVEFGALLDLAKQRVAELFPESASPSKEGER